MLKVKRSRFVPHQGIKSVAASFPRAETAAFTALLCLWGAGHLCCLHMETEVALCSQERCVSHAKSPRAAAPCSHARAAPQDQEGAVGHSLASGTAPRTDLGWRNRGRPEQQGLFCFLFLK